MKKHFLILMLMALLPLAGFADTFDVSKFSSKNFSYGADAFPANFITSTYEQVGGEDVWEADVTQFYGSTANTTDGTVDESLVYDAEDLATTPAGKYWIKITGKENSQFEGQEVYKDFWINPGKVFITFVKEDASMSKTYGEDDPEEFAFTAVVNEAEVEGDALEALMLEIGRVAGTDAGQYKFTAVSNNDNYTAYIEKWGEGEEAEDPYFTIDQKEITATVTLGDEVLTYTGSDQAPTITVLDEEENEIPSAEFTFTYKYRATAEGEFGDAAADHANAGYYKVVATPVEDGNYTLTEAENAISENAFQIKKQPLNIYVNSLTKVYDGTTNIYGTPENEDEPNIAPTIAYSGLVGEDASEATPFGANAYSAAYVTTNAPEDEGYAAEIAAKKNVSSTGYALKPVAGEEENAPTGNIANYAVNLLTTGKLKVTAKAIAIKPNDGLSKEIDTEDNFTAADIDVSEAIEADQANIAAAYKIVRSNADVEAVGEYEDVLSLVAKTDAELGDDAEAINATKANYTIDATATADFEITGGNLYVYPQSKAITYGERYTMDDFKVVAITAGGTEVDLGDATPGVVIDGYEEGDLPTDAKTYVLELDNTDITVDGYTVVTLTGQFTISKKTLPVTVKSLIMDNGDDEADLNEDKENKVVFAGKVEGDVIGFKLEFNSGEGDGLIPADKIEVVEGVKTLTEIANDTYYAKGIKISEVEATDEAPNDNANYNIVFADVTGELTVGGRFFLSLESEDADWDEIVKFDGEKVDVRWAPDRNQAIGSFAGDWKAKEWNAGILPFEVTVRELSNAFGYAIVNIADESKTTDSNVAFKLEMDKIPANTPFAIKTDADLLPLADLTEYPAPVDAENPTPEEVAAIAAWNELNGQIYKSFNSLEGFTIAKPEVNTAGVLETAVGNHKFVGVFKTVTIDKTTPNRHFLVNGAWKHIGASSSRTYDILPFNCYIESPEATAARGITFTFEELDGTTTAIKAIEADSKDFESAKTGIYTIGGMKLQSAPTQKGVYIKDGKKFVVK